MAQKTKIDTIWLQDINENKIFILLLKWTCTEEKWVFYLGKPET